MKRDGVQIQLTPLEFDLLLAWLDGRGRSSVARCCSSRCGATAMPPTRGWSTYVQRLRSKIEKDPEHPEIVVTTRIGYKAGETNPAR